MLVELGKPEEAAKVFLAYPQFKLNTGSNRIAIANQAYDMGNLFFRAGNFDLAKPLYRIAAAQDTGAGAKIGAATRLKLLDGNMRTPCGALSNARAGITTRARFAISLEYCTRSDAPTKPGWGLARWYSNCTRRMSGMVLVGHHMGGVSEAEVLKWSQQREFSDSGASRSYAAMYLARFATTDRIPSKDLAGEIDAMERPTWKLTTAPGWSSDLHSMARRERCWGRSVTPSVVPCSWEPSHRALSTV